MTYKPKKRKNKRAKRKKPMKKVLTAPVRSEITLPPVKHDVYADLMDVYYDEIDISNYIKGYSYDETNDCLFVNTINCGNVCYRFAYFGKGDKYEYIRGNIGEDKRNDRTCQNRPESKFSSIAKEFEIIGDEASRNHDTQRKNIKIEPINYNKMAKETSNAEGLKFRGVPIGGDSKSFVKVIKKNFGFENFDFKETSVELYGGQFVGEDVQLTVYYTHKSKTVYAVDIYFSNLSYEDEYLHYKRLYTQKYGTPKIIKDEYENDKAIYEIDGGRIIIYGNFNIMYVNTTNEKLANKEHDMALLDEI